VYFNQCDCATALAASSIDILEEHDALDKEAVVEVKRRGRVSAIR